ncbi:MAG TPA: caspase family protein [Fimbriimonadaceae bacterium]|nr:caspase family protein [Fimbriimonadaceae bacterium]
MRCFVAFVLVVGCLLPGRVLADIDRSNFSGATFVPPKRWAIVIGAQEYQSLGRLRCTVRDANSFAKLLVDQLKFKPDAIKLITDAKDSPLKPKAATIQAAIQETLDDKRLDRGDLFIFYFAGHGIGTPNGDFLLPTDATKENAEEVGLQAKDIVADFVEAGLKNVLIIADACRAGEKNQFGDELRRLGKEANIAVFLGCEPGKRSYEYPNLGHGAFTQALLKAFDKPELLSPGSGALWASKLGADVQTQVKEYTARDYPTSPQIPYIETERKLDVLLGVFPEDAGSHLTKFIKDANDLDPERFKISLLGYASQLYIQDRLKEAIEAYKTCESTFHLDAQDKFLLAICCDQAGRTGESQIYFKQLERDSNNPFFRELARMLNPSRDIPPATRVQAARELWKIDQSNTTAMYVYGAVQMYGSPEDLVEVLQPILANPNLEPRIQKFLEGVRDAARNQWAQVISEMEECLKIPGQFPDDASVIVTILAAKIRLGLTEDLGEFIQSHAHAAPDKEGEWLLLLADLRLEQGRRDEAMQIIKRALTKRLEPAQLLECIKLSGLRYQEIAEPVIKQAANYPDSWKAELAAYWMKQLGKPDSGDGLQKLIDSNFLNDDPFIVLFEAYKILDSQLGELSDKGRIDPMQYLVLIGGYASFMFHSVDKFGYDFEPWLLLVKFALLSEKYEQLKQVMDLHLGPFLEDGTLSIYLRAQYFFAAINMGDVVRAEKIWRMKGFHPTDMVDGGWVVAMEAATRGESVDRKLLPSKLPTEGYVGAAKAFLAYLDVCDKKAVDLAALLKQFPTDQSAAQWIALAYAKQGNWNKALPLMKSFYTQRFITLTFLQAKVAQVYFDELIASKKFDLANEVAFNMMISAFGNPLYKKIHFGPTVGVVNFAGKTDFDAAQFEIPSYMQKGNMSLAIDRQGVVSGSLKIDEDVYKIAGNVDGYGNVKATLVSPTKTWNMTGKVPPPRLYKTLPQFKPSGQAFLLLDADGQSQYLILKPKV